MAEDSERDDALFVNLVLIFQSAAMQQMGKIINPLTGKVDRNLEQARFSIDTLSMLKDKTRGNLSPDLERLLDSALLQLRMNFVDESRSAQPSESGEHDAAMEDQPQPKADGAAQAAHEEGPAPTESDASGEGTVATAAGAAPADTAPAGPTGPAATVADAAAPRKSGRAASGGTPRTGRKRRPTGGTGQKQGAGR